jgi:hypothetical protein
LTPDSTGFCGVLPSIRLAASVALLSKCVQTRPPTSAFSRSCSPSRGTVWKSLRPGKDPPHAPPAEEEKSVSGVLPHLPGGGIPDQGMHVEGQSSPPQRRCPCPPKATGRKESTP